MNVMPPTAEMSKSFPDFHGFFWFLFFPFKNAVYETSIKSAWQPQGMSLSCIRCVYSMLALLEETMEKFSLLQIGTVTILFPTSGQGDRPGSTSPASSWMQSRGRKGSLQTLQGRELSLACPGKLQKLFANFHYKIPNLTQTETAH